MVATEQGQSPEGKQERTEGLLATGGVIGALLAASCCVVPLVLVTLGISGAWIGNLTALEPFRPVFAAIAIALIGGGFWHVYFRKQPDCEDGSYCAKPRSSRITKTALWIGTILVLVSLTVGWWAPLFY